jgi:hypothetical protein
VTTAAQLHRTLDLLATDLLPECPTCGDLAPAGATRCECGQHLFVRQGAGRPFTTSRAGDVDPRCADVAGCTCGHAGICSRCIMHLLDNGHAL